MRRMSRLLLLVAAGIVALLVTVAGALADHATRPHSANMKALGHSPHPATFNGTVSALRNVNSDIAFWGDLGFSTATTTDSASSGAGSDPQELNWTHCNGDQGDIVVWGDILVRAWNSPAPADNPATPTPRTGSVTASRCPGLRGHARLRHQRHQRPGAGGRGGAECSSRGRHAGMWLAHATLVPDLDNNRVLVYNATSGGNTALPQGSRTATGSTSSRCHWTTRRGVAPAPRAARGRPCGARQRRDPR